MVPKEVDISSEVALNAALRSHGLKPRFWCYLLGFVLALGVVGARAQDADDDDASPDADPLSYASLTLHFDSKGSVDVSLSLPTASTGELSDALALTFHCPLNAMHHPDRSAFARSFLPKSWTQAQRERYEQQLAEINQRSLTGRCDAALVRQSGVLQSDFDYAPLLAELKRAGVDQLNVWADVPKTQYQDFGAVHSIRGPSKTKTMLSYVVPVTDGSKPAIYHVAYGFRQQDLHRALAILAGFLIVPILITLWMRRAALASAKDDAPAAWFGFMRSLNWMVTGAMLLWMTSGFGARQALEDWIASQGMAIWKAVAADVLIIVGPAWLLYFVCISLSYAVHEQLRGRHWTRREFLVRQVVVLGARVIPLVLAITAFGLLRQTPELSLGLLILAMVMLQVLNTLRLRVIKEFPQPLTTGELRDRIFDLGRRLGVTVNQIFVLPAGKGQVANAYAAKNRIVMFTDYLLEHLSKREVDAVAAHELAHLRHKHPAKLGFAMMAAIFLPFYFNWLCGVMIGLIGAAIAILPAPVEATRLLPALYGALNRFELWSQRDFVLIMLGLTAFYFLSRRFENEADATAVRLTNDPEAQITGLLKVSHLNFVPLQWGKFSENWLTHPSMVRRAHRIAAAGGMAPERLQEILGRYNAAAMPAVASEERYPVPPPSDPEKFKRALRERNRGQAKTWGLMLAHVLPLAALMAVVARMHLTIWLTMAANLASLALAAALLMLTGVWLGECGRTQEKLRMLQRFARERVPVGRDGDLVVGFAPGPYPRIFGTRYHWDSGFLVLAKDRLQFVGEQTRFSMLASEIEAMVISRGGPSWWKFERVYVRWKTQDGKNGVFNLYSLEPGSTWRSSERVREMYRRLQDWHQQPGKYSEVRPELADLKALELGQVTSVSPRVAGSFRAVLSLGAILVPLAILAAMLMHINVANLCLGVVAIRLFETIPYWRYRDVVPAFPEHDGKARSASAGGPI